MFIIYKYNVTVPVHEALKPPLLAVINNNSFIGGKPRVAWCLMNIQESPKFNWKELLWPGMDCLGCRSSGKMVWWPASCWVAASLQSDEQGSTHVGDPAGQRLLKTKCNDTFNVLQIKIQLLLILWFQNRLNRFAKQIFCSSTVEFPVCGVTWCHKTRGPAHSIAFPSLLSTWWQ